MNGSIISEEFNKVVEKIHKVVKVINEMDSCMRSLERAIRRAAEEAYESGIVETGMEDMEVLDSAFGSMKDFKEDWIGSKISGWMD